MVNSSMSYSIAAELGMVNVNFVSLEESIESFDDLLVLNNDRVFSVPVHLPLFVLELTRSRNPVISGDLVFLVGEVLV